MSSTGNGQAKHPEGPRLQSAIKYGSRSVQIVSDVSSHFVMLLAPGATLTLAMKLNSFTRMASMLSTTTITAAHSLIDCLHRQVFKMGTPHPISMKVLSATAQHHPNHSIRLLQRNIISLHRIRAEGITYQLLSPRSPSFLQAIPPRNMDGKRTPRDKLTTLRPLTEVLMLRASGMIMIGLCLTHTLD